MIKGKFEISVFDYLLEKQKFFNSVDKINIIKYQIKKLYL